MNSATRATTNAGVGRREMSLRMVAGAPWVGECATSRERQRAHIREIPVRSGLQLLHPALPRVLVLPPAAELRAVPDAVVGDVVERDLDHQLGAQLDPLELALGGPAAGVAAAALAGLVRGELGRQLALLGGVEARAVADRARVVGPVVEAEDERADRALLLAGPPAHHDGVDRAHALDLAHP